MKLFFKLSWPAALLLAAVAVFAVTGCQVEDASLDASRLRERPLIIGATYEDVLSAETKTVLRVGDDSKEHVYWVPGDAISLFYGSGTDGGSKFTAQATEETRVTNFSGKIGVVTGGDEIPESATYFWGLYPYDPEAECDGETVTMKIASLQAGAPDTFGSGFAPSLGRAKGLMLSFRNIYCGLYFTVTQPGFTSMTITSNNGEILSGRAKIGIDGNGEPELREILGGTNSVTVTSPTIEGFAVGKKYYVLFFPQTLTAGFTLTLSSSTQTGQFVVSSNVPFKRNQISNVKNLDSRITFSPLTVTRSSFPDVHFANYVFDNFDTDQDGELSETERNAVTTIRVSADTVATVKGIEFFPNLERLYVPGTQYRDPQSGEYTFNGQLTSIDLSGNPNLTLLQCDYNRLAELELGGNTNLTNLYCRCNLLTDLDVSSNTALRYLWCGGNQLTDIDVSNNPSLQSFSIYNNQISSLDVSGNTALTMLECSYNPIGTLNVNANTALTQLFCESNGLASLDISSNTQLVQLSCGYNNLTAIDFSNNLALTNLGIYGNQLTELDVSMLAELRGLYVYYNELGSIDVTNNTKLTELDVEGCGLASLDLSHNAQLTYLYCSNNLFTELDLSNNTLMNDLYCDGNANLQYLYLLEGQTITNINKDAHTQIVYVTSGVDIDANSFPDANFRTYVSDSFDTNHDGVLSQSERDAVTIISVYTDNIASIEGIGYFENLTSLTARVNSRGGSCGADRNWTLYDSNGDEVTGQLTSVDLSGNPALVSVNLYGNQLTSLDVSACPDLTSLNCGCNLLESLDLQNNTALEILDCSWNKISSLDLGLISTLRMITCGLNWIGTLDVSNNPSLISLDCTDNLLIALDISNNGQLSFLNCSSNDLDEINVSRNPRLTTFYLNDNQITSIDISKNTALANLECYRCALREIDMSTNLLLKSLGCTGNPNLATIWIPVGHTFDYLEKDSFTTLREKAQDNGGKGEGYVIGGGGVWDN